MSQELFTFLEGLSLFLLVLDIYIVFILLFSGSKLEHLLIKIVIIISSLTLPVYLSQIAEAGQLTKMFITILKK